MIGTRKDRRESSRKEGQRAHEGGQNGLSPAGDGWWRLAGDRSEDGRSGRRLAGVAGQRTVEAKEEEGLTCLEGKNNPISSLFFLYELREN